ncbi:MAG: T9SS type A sorting domain-containing protein [Bacteroidota bacterium]
MKYEIKKLVILIMSGFFPLFGLAQTGPGGVNTNNEFWVLAGSGITLSDTDVTTWADLSGNGNDAIQGISSERPSFDSSPINYNPSVYFDGTDEHLDINNLIASGSSAVHVFAVGTNEGGGDDWHCMVFGQSSAAWTGGGYGITALNTISTAFGFWVNDFSGNRVFATWSNRPFGVVEGKYDGTNVEFLLNSLSYGIDPYTGSVGDNGSTHLGGGNNTSFNHKGFISEVAIYSSALSGTDQAKINSYFGVKYSITQDRVGMNGNYLNSLGNTVFSDDGVDTYWNDIIGLARDDNSTLMQKQSQTPDDATRIYISTLTTDNTSNTGTFASDNQFVVMGHNSATMNSNGSTEFPSGLGIFSRLEREWKITNTNFDGTFSIDMKLNATSVNPVDLGILLDTDSDLSTGASLIFPTMSYNDDVLTISGLSTTDFPINSTHYFTVVSVDAGTTLPIELVDFTARPITNEYVQLNWQTASETNNSFFTIERSRNGENWQEVNKIDGAGNSSSILSYSDIDHTPFDGVSYYRLKQTDYDGQFEYSHIRSVNISQVANSQIKVYPNPAKNQIIVIGSFDELSGFALYNSTGQNVTSLVNQLLTNETQLVIDISKLNVGMYYIKTRTITNKVYKQ